MTAPAARQPNAGSAIADTVGEITELSTNHIWKGDEMVFPMVEHLFSDDERASLFERFQRAEEDIGAHHEALVSFADELDRKAATR